MTRITTLCYIRENGKCLMLLRDKKEHDENEGKWIGVGGKLEDGESPEECLLREVKEETGLTLTDYRFRGIITFISDVWGDELMLLYEGLGYTGRLRDVCEEGTLRWVAEEEVMDLNLWEGDRLFMAPFFAGDEILHMKLVYKGDTLTEAIRG